MNMQFQENIPLQLRKISLVGMSNVGKSHWSRALEEQLRFYRFCCDDAIATHLTHELKASGLSGDIADVSKWMGMPYEGHSTARQKRYVELEQSVVEHQALVELRWHDYYVIDATGSVIYLNKSALEGLRSNTTVVYLETPPSVQDEMLQRFLEHPKPVVWGDGVYSQTSPDEDPMVAIGRCYPLLLASRAEQYAELAHVTIPYEVHRAPDFSAEQLIQEIVVRLAAL